MLRYKQIIFDFDGTLSDSYPSFVKAMKTVMQRYGIEKSAEEIYLLLKKYSTAYVFDTCGFGEFKSDAKRQFRELSDELLRSEATPMAGAENILRFIAENGGYSYIYSHSGDIVLSNVKRWGLEGYFQDYQLGDTEFPRKPAPDALLNLMKKNGLNADECVMVGDRDIDILAGKNAGVAGILMDTEGYYPQLSVEYRISELKDIQDCLSACTKKMHE